MPSSPLANIHSQTTSTVACHHRLLEAHRIERCQALHAIIAFGQHTRSNDVGRGISPPLDNTHGQQRRQARHAIIPFGQHRQSNGVGRGMPSSPLDGKHGRTTSGVTCHHQLWTAYTVERLRASHAIIAFRQHTRSNDIRHGMLSSHLGSTNNRTTSGVACHHLLWGAHMIERCRALHAIIVFGQHTRSNDVGRGMT